MKNYYLLGFKPIFLTFILMVITTALSTIKAQSCNAIIPPATINGVSITSTFTGTVSSYPNPQTSCGSFTTPANSIHLGNNPFTYTLHFSIPVNCLTFILTATGVPGNEDFTFTTNSGVPYIIDNSSCFTTINGNTILSGAGAPGSGGGGDFTLINPQPFTSLTISGSGNHAGSLFGICEASVNPTIITENFVSICEGDSIYLAGEFQSLPGAYVDTITIAGVNCGFDSIVTTNLTINTIPSVTIDAIESVLCIDASPIVLTGHPAGGVFSGNGITGNNFNPTMAGIGSHIIKYDYLAGNNCVASEQILLNVVDIPIPIFSGDELIGCKDHKVNFTSDSIFSGGNCTWDFGDGTISNVCDSVTHIYTASGFYDVTLTIENAEGCVNSTTFTNYIEVIEGPTASFTANPIVTDYTNTEVFFTNESVNSSSYIWNFGDNSNQVSDIHPTHNFPTETTGNYHVTLYVTNDSGCMDSTSLMIKVVFPDLNYEIPNVFTPNGDNENDFFKLINAEYLFSLEVLVLNRWGNVVFESSDLEFKWNGKLQNKDVNCTDGTYFYKIKLKDMNGKEMEKHGFVHLLRGDKE